MSASEAGSTTSATSASLRPRAGARTAACFEGAFLAGAFFAGVFFAELFLAAVFLAAVFLAGVFCAGAGGTTKSIAAD